MHTKLQSLQKPMKTNHVFQSDTITDYSLFNQSINQFIRTAELKNYRQ